MCQRPVRVVFWTALAVSQALVAYAQDDRLQVRRSRKTNLAAFVTARDRGVIPVQAPKPGVRTAPLDFLREHGHLFGVTDPESELVAQPQRTDRLGHTHTTYDQVYKTVPVFSGILKIHQNARGEFLAANGDFYPIPGGLNTTPTLTLDAAELQARARLTVAQPQREIGKLVIVDPDWYGDPPTGVRLAYYLILSDLTAGVREAFFVDAHTGEILDQWNLIHTGMVRKIHDANGAFFLPGTLARFEGDGPVADPPEANTLYDYFGDVYGYYFRAFGRDSIDNMGLTMIGTLEWNGPFLLPCPNAFWSGKQAAFCAETVADDVAAHEIAHGITQYTADLLYQNQSGQLNESYSDIFGELIDLFNGDAAFAGPPGGIPWPAHPTGPGLDTPNDLRSACSPSPAYPGGVRWLITEDGAAWGGKIRDMWDPTCYGDPDRANSPLQTCDDDDNGGVHSGSGVGNHAFAIMTDGKTFNGFTVTGIGPIKAAAVWYRALTTYLSVVSDFKDAYNALNQAAADLIGTTPNDPRTGLPSASMFTAADAAEVDKALLAVEMNTEGACGATPAICTTSAAPCCSLHSSPGCSDPECCTIVCNENPACCSGSWTLACAVLARDECPLGCRGACCLPDGSCTDVRQEECPGWWNGWDTFCSGVDCSTCPCNGDTAFPGGPMTGSDIVRVVECVQNFESDPICDVNCDGVVTTRDLSDAICRFSGFGAGCCSLPYGPCCDDTPGPLGECRETHAPPKDCDAADETYLGDGRFCVLGPCDCNDNGIKDLCDTRCGPAGGVCDVPGCGQSADCDDDGVPDECEDPDPNTIGICCTIVDSEERCEKTTEAGCAVGSVWGGVCTECPAQRVRIINEPAGSIIIHTVGPPLECVTDSPTAASALQGCPGPFIDPWITHVDGTGQMGNSYGSNTSDVTLPPLDGMCHYFGIDGSPEIPAGFFGVDSDAFAGPLCLQGVSLNHPDFGDADTLIERLADPFDRCAVPSATESTVSIHIVALSLRSIHPITVTYNSGQTSDQWDVAVDLSAVSAPNGSLTATKTRCNGGTYTSILPVRPRFTFTKVGNPGQTATLDTGLEGQPPIVFQQVDPATWVSDVDASLPVLIDVCSAFHGGIDTVYVGAPCDCNGNSIRDTCELENAQAADCNMNAQPDECDIMAGLSDDADNNGRPDECPLPPAVIPDLDGETTRSLSFTAPPPVIASASDNQTAIKVTMIDLQNPNPRNGPANPPKNYTTYDTDLNGVCSGAATSPNFNGHHCHIDADCLGPDGGISSDDGVCSSLVACTAAAEANSCARWVGKPGTFLESQENSGLGSYRAARLQCTPFYYDWITETAIAPITVVGGEIAPSSTYTVEVFGASCKGNESTCVVVSSAITMTTRRFGDVVAPFNPPVAAQQPDGSDVVQLVNKFKNQPGAPGKAITLIQPNLPELNSDVSGSDIVQCVDAFKSFAYPFGGPCPCPSQAACGALSCPSGATVCTNSALPGLGAAATCIKTCAGGDNNGDPCVNNTHCPGGGTCGNPFCYDRCGRCTP